MNMEAVKLIDIIHSKSAVSPRTAILAYDYAASKLSEKTSLQISFEGIEDLTSAFCNAFIGKLYMNFDPAILNSELLLTNISADHIWMRKIESAINLGTNENARNLHKDNLEDVILS